MAIITYKTCLCCGSTSVHKVLSCRDYTVSQETFEVWECANCTFRFTRNAPGEEAIAPYYQSAAYVSHSDTKQGLVNRLYHVVRGFTLKSKCNLVADVTGQKNGSLVDIGAGTGAFAHTMKSAGWNVTGIEPDATARNNALKNYGLHLQESDQLHQLAASSVDAITMWHVLEHVHDLHGYLQTLRRVIKPSGKLFIAVPNYTSYDAKVYQQHWAAYDVPRHLHHFSPKSMKVLLENQGFVLEAVKPMWFDSVYVSMLSEQYQQGRSNFVKALWIGMMSNLRAVVDVQKCSSVIYIISKQ
jgi:2-polyprenyl-3-methyl-5-hydroxy-6-metoxy-1,4-benzoquinol methylase